MTAIRVDHLIVGAGIAGLTYAYFAQKKGQKALVLEPSDRSGGVIQSERKQGFLLEYGPNTVMTSPDLLSLVDDLGLSGQMILASSRIPRYILLRKKLHKAPLSPKELLKTKLLSAKAKLRLLWEPFISKRTGGQEESLAQFIERRLGPEIARSLAAPFISGVWAGDIDRLSAQATFPKLTQLEQENGSLFRGLVNKRKKKAENSESSDSPQKTSQNGLLSFKEGLETLPRALANRLGQSIIYQCPIQRIEEPARNSTGMWRIVTGSTIYEAPNLALAAPAYQTARFVEPFAPEASDALNRIPYVPLIVMHVSVRREDIGHPLQGFGYLVAPEEQEPILGCLWSSSVFPDRAPGDSVLLTVFLGGATKPELCREPDGALLEKVEKSVAPILDLQGSLTLLSARRYEKAIPQYNIGHLDLARTLKEAGMKNPGLSFIGNYLEGISVGDVVRLSKSAANSNNL